MTTMMTEMYDALCSCGATEEQAHAAAQAIAAYEARLVKMEVRLKFQQWLTIVLFVLLVAFWVTPLFVI